MSINFIAIFFVSFLRIPALRRLVNSPGAAQSAELTQLSQNTAVRTNRQTTFLHVHKLYLFTYKLKVTK